MNRIQLLFNRNRDAETTGYRVYRAGLPGVSRNSLLVMEIDQPTDPTWIEVKDEVPVKLSEASYKLNFKHICSDKDKPAVLYLDGIEAVYSISYSIDYEEGIVNFAESVEGRKVTASYFFDGVTVVDDDIYEGRTDIKYHGPSPLDYSPPNINNAVLTGDNETNSVTLSFQTSSDGENYYYRIEAVDIEGYFSNLCDEKVVHFRSTPIAVIEKSTNNGSTWKEAARTATSSYTESGIDKDKPNPVTKLAIQTSYEGYVYLDWYAPVDTVTTTASPKYRVYTITEAGLMSVKTPAVGPVFIKTPLDKIVVRRKVWNGAYPTYNGNDGITVATLEPNVQQYMDTLYQKGKHAYAVYVVDKGGNVSIAATAIADMDHATRLTKPIVTANPIDVLYGLEDMPTNVGPYFTYVGMKAGSLTSSGWTVEFNYNDAEHDQIVINILLNEFPILVSPTLNSTTGHYEFTLSEITGGTYEWQLVIGDIYNSSSDFSNKFVTSINNAPQLSNVRTKSTSANKFVIEWDMSDNEGDIIGVSLQLDGGTFNTIGPTWNGVHWEYIVNIAAGDHTYRLKVADANNPAGIFSDIKSVTVLANQSPQISSVGVKLNSLTSSGYTAEFSCSDIEGDTIIFKISTDGSAFIPIAPYLNPETSKYEIPVSSSPGSHSFQINVSDASNPAGTNSGVVNVTVPADNLSKPMLAATGYPNGDISANIISFATDMDPDDVIVYDIWIEDSGTQTLTLHDLSPDQMSLGYLYDNQTLPLGTSYPIGKTVSVFLIARDSNGNESTSDMVQVTIPGNICKIGGGRVWEWNKADLNQFDFISNGSSGTAVIDSGTIHVTDTSASNNPWLVTKTMDYIKNLSRFELQVNVKQVPNAATPGFCFTPYSSLVSLAASSSLSAGFTANGLHSTWTVSSTTNQQIYSPANKYDNAFLLQKHRYNLDRTTPANSTYQYIADGNALSVRNEVQLTNMTGFKFAGNDAGLGDYYLKDVLICRDWYVTVTNLPLGYQARIGNSTASESSGVAKIDGANITWGKDLNLQILNPEGKVIVSYAPPEGIYGGDTFTYSATSYLTLLDTVFTTDPTITTAVLPGDLEGSFPLAFPFIGKVRTITDFTINPTAGSGKYMTLAMGPVDASANKMTDGRFYYGDVDRKFQVQQINWSTGGVDYSTELIIPSVYDNKLYRMILEYDKATGITQAAITKDLTDTSISGILPADLITVSSQSMNTSLSLSKFGIMVRDSSHTTGSIAYDAANNRINWSSGDTTSYTANGVIKYAGVFGWDANNWEIRNPRIFFAKVGENTVTSSGFKGIWEFQCWGPVRAFVSIDGGSWTEINTDWDPLWNCEMFEVTGLSPGRHYFQIHLVDDNGIKPGTYSELVYVNIPSPPVPDAPPVITAVREETEYAESGGWWVEFAYYNAEPETARFYMIVNGGPDLPIIPTWQPATNRWEFEMYDYDTGGYPPGDYTWQLKVVDEGHPDGILSNVVTTHVNYPAVLEYCATKSVQSDGWTIEYKFTDPENKPLTIWFFDGDTFSTFGYVDITNDSYVNENGRMEYVVKRPPGNYPWVIYANDGIENTWSDSMPPVTIG